MAAVMVSVVGVDYWLFAVHGLGQGLEQILRNPIDLLAVLGLTLLSGAFHECGHATGCRYSGARPGVIGVGIYLVWPSFFTNVTDSYRLSRAGRLRTDLGGLYFNAVFILAGVPDMFARVVPIVRSVLPGGRPDPRVAGLRRRTRILVTGWVLVVIPLLIALLGYLLLRLPAFSRALWRSISQQGHLMVTAAAGHHYAMAAVDAIGAALVTLSLAGTLYVMTMLARRAVTVGLRWSAGRPRRRLGVAAGALAGVATLAAWWTVTGQFLGW